MLSTRQDALPSGFALPYWVQFTIDGRVLAFTVGITLMATIVSGLVPAWLSAHGNAAEMMKEGGRGNSSRLVNVITRASGRRPNRADCRAADCGDTRDQIDPKPALPRLWLRRERRFTRARMALMEGAYPTRMHGANFSSARSCLARQSAVRFVGAERSVSHDLCRPAVSMKLTAKII